ncbi:MAG: head GIN domain-containing protein [Chloroflexota bacterium]
MKKRIYLPSTILLIALFLSSCGFRIITGSGNVITETRDVTNFSRITLAGSGDVYVTQGEEVSVRIEAEDNLIPYFGTTVQGDTLTIGIKHEYFAVNLHPLKPVKFYVTSPNIEAVKLAGSGNIHVDDIQTTGFDISLLGSGNISTDNLSATDVNIKLAGSGNITLGTISATEIIANIAGSGNIRMEALTTDKVASTISGSGNISLVGEAIEQRIEILGSGDYRANGLKTENASVRVAGSGNSQISVTDTLDVTILGSGDVVYIGSPKMNVSVSGSGRVNQSSQP